MDKDLRAALMEVSVATLSTVGYGDISPVTAIGQFVASMLMLLGYAIIAVPTGIVSIEMNNASSTKATSRPTICLNCEERNHSPEARFCHSCGNSLS